MAHELSHVTQRHISRMISRQSAQAPWLMGAMMLAILAASKNPGAANAAIVGGQAAAAQSQLNFSRDMEREADRVGYGVMTQAGFEPQGMVGMFEKLQQASRLNDTGGFPYLRSHPLTTERMADMQARVPQGATKKGAPAPAPVLEHVLVSVRARVLANAAVDDLRSWSAQIEPGRLTRLDVAQQSAMLYGATLAALKLRDYPQAQSAWLSLTDVVRADAAAARLVRLLGAELALAQKDGARAMDLLLGPVVGGRRTVDIGRITSRAELFLLAQASLQAAQAPLLTSALQTWVAEHPRDATGWQQLSSVYAAQGRMLGAVRAEAEVHAAQQDYAGALLRFKSAQDLARNASASSVDHIEASIVDTRTRQMEMMIREQALER
jgi:predicted Zn-dependent protease